MKTGEKPIRVLYSFPHKLGGGRIQTTAWEQVQGLMDAGAAVLVYPGVLKVPLRGNVTIRPTLSVGRLRLPYKLLGTVRTCALHDAIVARRLRKLAGQIDIVHVWPLGAVQTLKVASQMGIPAVLERPNAHTRYAYGIVQKECERLGVSLPHNHEHAFNLGRLNKEEEEYRLSTRLLCPSDFVIRTFLEQGFPEEKLARHAYGFNSRDFFPGPAARPSGKPFTMLFAGVCAVRKGLHFALEAWLKSSACRDGQFLVAGSFIPSYEEKLRPLLAHPSIRVLGHRSDVAELMRSSDVLVLPTLEEGSALVTYEARASGCVLLVSEAAGAVCKSGENALVHKVGDVAALAQHISLLHDNAALLEKLRAASLQTVDQITWTAAGMRLLQVYRDVLNGHPGENSLRTVETNVPCVGS